MPIAFLGGEVLYVLTEKVTYESNRFESFESVWRFGYWLMLGTMSCMKSIFENFVWKICAWCSVNGKIWLVQKCWFVE